MKNRMKMLLFVLLLCLTVGTVLAVEQSHEIVVNIPQFIELNLSQTAIDLGSFMDETGNLLNQLVTVEPLNVSYRCNSSNGWTLTVSATDFIDDLNSNSFSVNQLMWGTDPLAINNSMLLTGDGSSTVATGTSPALQTTDVYYSVLYPENTYAGNYTSVVTYTLIAN